MDTIYALTIILSGFLVPHADADENVLSGEVENRTTIFYKTLESCEQAYQQALASAEQMTTEQNAVVVVKPCEGMQVAE